MYKNKALLLKFLLLLASSALFFVFVEIIFRVSSDQKRADDLASKDRPRRFFFAEEATDLRDYPHNSQKEANTFRIAVVGDSFSFAPYLPFDFTFAKNLERILNLNKLQPRVEVINYGVPRYSTYHEVYLVGRALSEQADLILLQITLNDPQIQPYRPNRIPAARVDRFGNIHFEQGILAHWKSAGFIVQRIYNLLSRKRYIEFFFELFDNPKGWSRFCSSIDKINELAHERAVPVVGVVFPLYGLPLDDAYPFLPLHQKIKQLLDSRGIVNLDLFERFKGIPVSRLQTIPGKDFHPNEIGHRIAAESIYDFLAEHDFVPPEVRPLFVQRERLGIYPRKRPAAASLNVAP